MKPLTQLLKKSGAIFNILLFISCIAYTQNVSASGTVTKTYTVKEFSELKASAAFDVEFIQSNENKVMVEIDEKAADNVFIGNQGNELIIKLKEYNEDNIHTMKAKVYGNTLSGITVSGAASFSSDHTFAEKNMRITTSGAAKIDIDIQSEKLILDMSGASKAAVQGSAGKQVIEASGASHYDGKKCKSSYVDITASGASKIVIDCTDTLDAKASGASHISYISTPKTITKDESGASDISLN